VYPPNGSIGHGVPMDHDSVRDVVLARALPAAFESACLIRCADLSLQPGRRAAVEPPAALAEFDSQDAASRLTALLTSLGCAASREVRTGGGRRRYTLQRIEVPEAQRGPARRMMAAAWRQGRLALLSTEPLGPTSPRNTQRRTLARAAWRAALLAGGRRRRGGLIWVRVGDHETAALLVRAARLLDVTAEVTARPGCILVAVPAAAPALLAGGVPGVRPAA
jgi:hypothetical protein